MDFFLEGWGLTYTHAGFGCSFLVFRARGIGGLWGGGELVLYALKPCCPKCAGAKNEREI